MTPVQAIIAKELRAAFVSPVVYVVAAVFLLVFGIWSYLAVVAAGEQALRQMQMPGAMAQLNLNEAVFRPTFYFTGFYLLLPVLPLLTMRLLAEERKLCTFELLATSPIGITDIVLGKFLGVYLIFLGLLGLTGLVPLIVSAFNSFEWNPIFTAYLGLALLGGLFLAIGVFASALTENQIIAAFLSFGFLILLLLVGIIGFLMGDTLAGHALSYLSFYEHFDRLVRGLVETKDIIYFLSGVVFMIFLAHRVVESHRWR